MNSGLLNNDLLRSPKLVGASLKRLRIAHDLTVQAVAERSGLSKSFVSMVESGSRSLKFHDLRRVLACFDYSVGWLVSQMFDDAKSANGLTASVHDATGIVQPRQCALLLDGSREMESVRLWLLRPLRSQRDAEFLELTLPPRSQFSDEAIMIAAEVRGVVQRGTLLITLHDGKRSDEHRARQGDEFCFDGAQPHVWRNYTDEPTVVTLVITPAAL